MSNPFFYYMDDLLALQSEAIERHEHRGIKGAAREEFISEQIKKILTNLNGRVHTGDLLHQGSNLGQQDILIRKESAMNTEIGRQIQLCCTDCDAFIEVKTSLSGTHLSKVEETAKIAKMNNPDILAGVFAYRTVIKKKTILDRFGYKYNEDVDMVSPAVSPNMKYPNIDFIICLSCKRNDSYTETGLYLTKDNQNSRFVFFPSPHTEYFMNDLRKSAGGVQS